PTSIERIEILTGPQASTIYGSNALNGVMQIFTKRGTGETRPQLTASLVSGWVQNNYSPALTPVHTYDARLSGMEGRWSYQLGGSWNHTGAWTPARKTERLSGNGGVRMQWGPLSADASARRAQTRNNEAGWSGQAYAIQQTTGLFRPG